MIKMCYSIFRFDGGRNEHISLTNARYTAESVGLCQESGTWFDEELRRATHLPGEPAGKVVNSPTRNGAFSDWDSLFMLLFHIWKTQISYQVYRSIDWSIDWWVLRRLINWLSEWLVDWLIDECFVDWFDLSGSLIDWLIIICYEKSAFSFFVIFKKNWKYCESISGEQ